MLLAIIKPKASEFIDEFDPGGDLRQAEQLSMELHFRDEIVFDVHVKTEIEDQQLEISFLDKNVVLGTDFEVGKEAKINLKRDAKNPRHFRSQSYILGDAFSFKKSQTESSKQNESDEDKKSAGDTYLDVPTDRLLLVSGSNWLRPRLPKERQIRVILPYPDQEVKRADETISGDFIAALKMSTICAGSTVLTDWDRLSVKQESDISRGIWDRRSVKISYGQHAAMLLVSGAFINQAEAYLDELNSLRSNTTGRAFKRAAVNVWTETPSLITELAYAPVTGIYVQIHSLKNANPSMLNKNGEMRGEFRRVFEKLLVDQTNNLRSAIAVMKSKPLCDVDGLLTTVGRGFTPVIAQLKKKVTRLQTNSTTGVKVRRPDMVAIRELDRLSTTFNELSAKTAYSEAQLDTINAVASVGGLAAGVGAAYYGSTILAGLALAADGVDFASTCSEHICGYIEDQENLAFGRAASSVIGSEFFDAAEGKAQETWKRALLLGVSGAAAGSSAFDVYKNLVRGAPKGGLDEVIDSLVSPASPADLKDVYETATGLEEFLNGKEDGK